MTDATNGWWHLNLALQSIPQILCNGDAFSDDDFQMMDTKFGRLLAFRLRPGTYEVTDRSPRLNDGGLQMVCRNYPDGGTHEDFHSDQSNPYARLCTIASDGSLTVFDSSNTAQILDDLWGTYVLYRTATNTATINPDATGAWFMFSRSPGGSYEPHVGTTRFVGSTADHAANEAPNVMDITYTKANVIQAKNRVV